MSAVSSATHTAMYIRNKRVLAQEGGSGNGRVGAPAGDPDKKGLTRRQMAWRAAQELQADAYVNLGRTRARGLGSRSP